jgi:hypothetical protein
MSRERILSRASIAECLALLRAGRTVRRRLGTLTRRAVSGVVALSLAAAPVMSTVPRALAAEAGEAGDPVAQAPEVPVPIEARERWTADSRHWRLPDGGYKAEFYTGPVNFQDAAGQWRMIDPSLVPDPGGWKTAAAPTEVRFSQDGASRNAALSGDGWSVRMSSPGRSTLALAEGAKIHYAGVATGTAAVYEALGDGVKETFILDSAEAPCTFTSLLAIEGLEVRRDSKGWRLFRPGTTTAVLTLEEPFATDSSTGDAGEPSYVSGSLDVVETPEGVLVTCSIPRSWLQDGSRVFPVYVDPTLSATNAGDSWVSSNAPTSTNGTSTELRVGTHSSPATGTNLAYVTFNESSLTTASYIKSATLSVYQFSGNSGGGPVTAGSVQGAWSEGSLTYNNRPAADDIVTTNTAGGACGWVNFNVQRRVQQVAMGWYANNGYSLYEPGGYTTVYRKLYSKEYSNSALRPKLTVVYDTISATMAFSKSQYSADDSDTVVATLTVNTAYPNDVCEAWMIDADGYGGAERSEFLWSGNKLGAQLWDGYTWTAGAAGSWWGDSLENTRTAFQPTSCVCATTTSSVNLTYKWRLKPGYGDVQVNNIWCNVFVGDYATGYRLMPDFGDAFDVLPAPVTSYAGSQGRGLDWWRAQDTNGDGLPDTPDDEPRVGRGAIDLDWAGSATAKGYRVLMNGGRSWEQVGESLDSSSSAWSSEGLGIYPEDSEPPTYTPKGYLKSLVHSASPGAGRLVETFTATGSIGAGVSVTDGTYLYVRPWSGAAAPWRRYGTGADNTVRNQDYGSIGASLTPVKSAFYLNGFIYSGYAYSPTTIRGVWRAASAGTTQSTTFTFGAPLLDRSTSAEITKTSSQLLLATDGEHIYSAGRDVAGAGFKVREYGADGTFIADHTFGGGLYANLDGFMCDGNALYLIEWTASDSARVTKVAVSDWRAADQWTLDQGATGAINGCYDPVSNVFWLGKYNVSPGLVYMYSGPGLDLRDNPNPLYQKMDSIDLARILEQQNGGLARDIRVRQTNKIPKVSDFQFNYKTTEWGYEIRYRIEGVPLTLHRTLSEWELTHGGAGGAPHPPGDLGLASGEYVSALEAYAQGSGETTLEAVFAPSASRVAEGKVSSPVLNGRDYSAADCYALTPKWDADSEHSWHVVFLDRKTGKAKYLGRFDDVVRDVGAVRWLQ